MRASLVCAFLSIVITPAAFEAIGATLPLGSGGYGPRRAAISSG